MGCMGLGTVACTWLRRSDDLVKSRFTPIYGLQPTSDAFNQRARASNLLAMAPAIAFNLLAMASNLLAMASNLLAMASNLLATY